jgi:uncharacterized SAM-dependent methyltransferase
MTNSNRVVSHRIFINSNSINIDNWLKRSLTHKRLVFFLAFQRQNTESFVIRVDDIYISKILDSAFSQPQFVTDTFNLWD